MKKRKAKKVSSIARGKNRRAQVSKVAKGRGAKARVLNGSKERTSGGLKKSDLVRNKEGRVVSKKSREAGKLAYQKNGIAKFIKAVQQARKALGIKGFQAVGGKTARGQALLKKARSFYKK